MRRLWALLALLFPGCLLLPQDIPDAAQDMANRPPRIISDLVSPSAEQTVVVLNSNCLEHRFYAHVTDPDADIIYYRFFINYHFEPQPYDNGGVFTSNNGGEPVQIESYLPGSGLFNYEAAVDQGFDFDVVELLISDRPFAKFPSSADENIDPSYREVTIDGLIDSYTWIIVRRDLGPCVE